MEADLGVPKNLHTIRGVINRLGNLNAVHPSMSQLEYVYLVYKIVHLGLRSTASFKSNLKSAPTKQLAHYVRGGLNLLGIIDDSVYDRTLRAPKVAIPAIITPQALLMNMLCEELSQLVLSLVSRGLVRSAFYRPELADDRRQFMLVTLGTKHKFMMVADAHPLGKPEVIIAEWLQGYYPVEEGLVALINRTIPEPHTLVPGDFLSMDPESVRSLEEEMVVNPGNLFFDEGTHPRPDRRGKPKPGRMIDSTTIIQSQETTLRSTRSATKKKDRTQGTDEEAPVSKKNIPSNKSKTPKKKKLSLLQKKVRSKYVKYPDTSSETEEEEEFYPMTRDYKRVRVEDLQLDEIRNLSKESYKAFKKDLGVDPQNLLNNPAFQFSAKHQEKLVKAVKGKKSKGVTVSQKKAKATTKLAPPFPDLDPYMYQETINDGTVVLEDPSQSHNLASSGYTSYPNIPPSLMDAPQQPTQTSLGRDHTPFRGAPVSTNQQRGLPLSRIVPVSSRHNQHPVPISSFIASPIQDRSPRTHTRTESPRAPIQRLENIGRQHIPLQPIHISSRPTVPVFPFSMEISPSTPWDRYPISTNPTHLDVNSSNPQLVMATFLRKTTSRYYIPERFPDEIASGVGRAVMSRFLVTVPLILFTVTRIATGRPGTPNADRRMWELTHRETVIQGLPPNTPLQIRIPTEPFMVLVDFQTVLVMSQATQRILPQSGFREDEWDFQDTPNQDYTHAASNTSTGGRGATSNSRVTQVGQNYNRDQSQGRQRQSQTPRSERVGLQGLS
eukprot:gene9463-19655_t